MPSPYLLVTVQSTMALIVYFLLAKHYLLPRLARHDFFAALAPLLLIQGFRFLGLSLLAPGQVAPTQNTEALTAMALGDLASAVVGVLAALAAYRRSAATVPLAWGLTVVGLADFAMIGYLVSTNGSLEQGLGFMWAALSLAAPVFLLSHVFIVRMLLTRRDSAEARA